MAANDFSSSPITFEDVEEEDDEEEESSAVASALTLKTSCSLSHLCTCEITGIGSVTIDSTMAQTALQTRRKANTSRPISFCLASNSLWPPHLCDSPFASITT